MMARVFCMASAKGGSGKTVLAATFGTFLASMDKRVLLVDTDAATNGLSLFYLRNVVRRIEANPELPTGLFEWSPGDSLDVVEIAPGLDLLPATYRFQNTESIPLADYRASLRSCVGTLRDGYDYIFLDAQAGSDEFAQVAIDTDVSDRVIIVSEYDPISAAGVERLKALFAEELEYRRTWILLNKMLPEFVKSFSDFMEIARYLSPVPWTSDVVRSYARRELALDLDEGNDYTIAIVQTLRTLLYDDARGELDDWLDQRTRDLREPITAQLKEIDRELGLLYQRRSQADRAITRLRATVVSVASILGAVFVVVSVLLLKNDVATLAPILGVGTAAQVFLLALSRVERFNMSRHRSDQYDRDIVELESRRARLRVLQDMDMEDLVRSRR